MTSSEISAPERIEVQSPEGSYAIYIGEKSLRTLDALLRLHSLSGRAAIVTNHTLAPIYGELLSELLGAPLIAVPDGEQYKTLETVRTLYDRLLELGIDRRGVVIALGGGVIGDLAGFAAATYLRGIAFVQAPTSLLAMVDASIGGKVGVDLPQGKNLVGAFKQPAFIVVDPTLLPTLPDIEWICGTAEIIKAGLLRDEALLDADLYRRDNKAFIDVLRRAIQIKVDYVQRDPYEQNIRAELNLGHTFAHAVEKVSGYTWRHGEAVGFGLVAAARLSYAVGLCEAALPERVESLVSAVGLPTRCSFEPSAVRAAMRTDKKRQGETMRFVLLRGVAQPEIRDDVPAQAVLDVLESLRH
ncbi:MAG: 3-dehydroquinate synthase [Anaerolineae bacterium]|nr:3-dehydroquinate synthase [Anaerolineae bacterium]MDW8299134.1 3-dehydroquinate synthase [Anaerolineae bacterium]